MNLSLLEKWVNDEVINTFVRILDARKQARLDTDPQYSRSYFMSGFLVPKIIEVGFESARRWGRMAATPHYLFDGRFIFFPINQEDSHYVLVVADVIHKQLKFYYTTQYPVQKYNSFQATPLDAPGIDWDITMVENDHVPYQQNGYSCGPFIMAIMESDSGGLPLTFTEQDMQQTYRKYIAWQLMAYGTARSGGNRSTNGRDVNTTGMAKSDKVEVEVLQIVAGGIRDFWARTERTYE